MKVIETVSGEALWHAHSSESSEVKNWIRNVGLPVVISDLNNDGVEELLSIFKKVVVNLFLNYYIFSKLWF